MEIDFPEIVDPPATSAVTPPAQPTATALAVATVTVKQAALAKFTQTEKDLRTLAERYRDVAFDCSTPKGLREAKAARHDLRENGRFAVQRVRDATKEALNSAKKDVEKEADRLIAIVKPIEDGADKQITAREEEIEREAEKEAARKKAHTDTIATIVAYGDQGRGKDSATLAKGIAFVEALDVSEARFEEFAPAAAEALKRTLERLRELHAKALEDERIRAENEARQRALKLIAQINAHMAEGIGENSEALAQRLVALKALAPDGGASDDVVTAILTAGTQLEAMLDAAKRTEDMQRQLDAMRAAQAPVPAPALTPVWVGVDMAAPARADDEPGEAVSAGVHDEEDADDAPTVYAPLRNVGPAGVVVGGAGPYTTTKSDLRALERTAFLAAAEALGTKFGVSDSADGWYFTTEGLADLIGAARAA